MIKAIQTTYKGYRFRSRLEARWAVFFDALGIEWQYEPEGFELPGGERYLPDFYLPRLSDRGVWVEVKPQAGEQDKALAFAKASRQIVLLVVGPPDHREYDLWEPEYVEEDVYIPVGESHCRGEKPLPVTFRRRTNHAPQLWYWPESIGVDGRMPESQVDRRVLQAIHAARSARFEFGESGATA